MLKFDVFRTIAHMNQLNLEHVSLDLMSENPSLIVRHKTKTQAYPLKQPEYLLLNIHGCSIQLHVVVWVILNGPVPEGFQIDHEDGDQGNNLPSNLRLATRSQQAQNTKTRTDNVLGHKGVSQCKQSGKFRAEITVNKKTIRLGRHDTLEEAVQARKDAEKIYHPFART